MEEADFDCRGGWRNMDLRCCSSYLDKFLGIHVCLQTMFGTLRKKTSEGWWYGVLKRSLGQGIPGSITYLVQRQHLFLGFTSPLSDIEIGNLVFPTTPAISNIDPSGREVNLGGGLRT